MDREPQNERWLLELSYGLGGVAFIHEAQGDFESARQELEAAQKIKEDLDKILGTVLSVADGSFNTLLELGFASSIRKEREWRISRGESTANLEAFRGWLERDES